LSIAEGWEGAGVGTAPRAGVGTAPTGGVGAAASAGTDVGAGTGVSVDVTGGKTIAATLPLAEPEAAGVATTLGVVVAPGRKSAATLVARPNTPLTSDSTLVRMEAAGVAIPPGSS